MNNLRKYQKHAIEDLELACSIEVDGFEKGISYSYSWQHAFKTDLEKLYDRIAARMADDPLYDQLAMHHVKEDAQQYIAKCISDIVLDALDCMEVKKQ